MKRAANTIALIVGSGFAHAKFDLRPTAHVQTPFGSTSSPILKLDFDGFEVNVIARHGLDNEWAPHAVNYRANIWALHELGVTHCMAFNVVGGIDRQLRPGVIAVPHQLVDYTCARESSFGGPDGEVVHIEFTEPFSPHVRDVLESACVAQGVPVHRGIYAVTQGPRLETAAEIDRLERDGCTMVGMTAMPEAALAREVGIEYAVLAGVVNHAAGRAPQGRSLHAEIIDALESVMACGQAVLVKAAVTLAEPTLQRESVTAIVEKPT
ncbi:MAG: S-methyl-5'-thioinosine phosphorylase [Gammaproteobacteria bacterium]|jgi:purine nucleoside phosphorylase